MIQLFRWSHIFIFSTQVSDGKDANQGSILMSENK